MTSSYFLPGTIGGDHAFKVGYRWRRAHSTSLNHRGGYIDARLHQRPAELGGHLARPVSESHLDTHAFYVQDTFTRNR